MELKTTSTNYMKSNIKKHFEEAQSVIGAFLADDTNFEKIDTALGLMVQSIKDGGKILSCGNGGSMCDAMHFAEELTGKYRNDRPAIAAISMSDVSHMACVGNDYGYDFVFSRYLEAVGKKGDVLLAISTSGNSKNIINAIEVAKKLGISVKYDNRDTQKPGFKFAEWELKGVPVRIALGPNDLENGTYEIARRDNLSKEIVGSVFM
jgi:D-sedoheptulose 7-phosphate isomerase